MYFTKRLISIVMCLLLMFTAFPLEMVSAETEDVIETVDSSKILGDANEDSKVNVKDATAIQKYVASIISFIDSQIMKSDANEDGKVNVKDATAIQKYIAGIELDCSIGAQILLDDSVSGSIEYNSFMEGFTDIRITDEESAIEAIDSVSDSIGIENVTEELKINRVQTVKNDTFYRVQQYYNGIPVFGRSMVLSANKDGEVTALTSNYKPISDNINLNISSTKTEIKNSICQYLSLEEVNDFELSNYNLTIYTLDNEDVLAYIFELNDIGTIVVDANTSKVLHYSRNVNDIVAAVTTADGTVFSVGWMNDDGSYHLYNDEHKIAVFDVQGINTVINDEGSVHTDFRDYGIDTLYSVNNVFEEDAIVVLNDVIDISEYYEELGFVGFEQVHVAINDSYDDGKNARGGGGVFDGIDSAIILIGENFDFSNKEVVAHEYTHAVSGLIVNWSSNFEENNALNEAYSDIFGALFENEQNPDWEMEHLSEVIRDLSNPEKTGGYDNTSDINKEDNYNQYTLSTIVSHSAYLMWNGLDDIDNGRIDAMTLSELWYRSMFLLQSNANFSQCRNAVELSARMMLRNKQITEEQYKTVIRAFEEVGIDNAVFSATETVTNDFDLSVLSSEGTENVHFKLEVIKMPIIKAGPGVVNEQPKLVKEIAAITGHQSLSLKDGTYVLRISEINDERNISEAINVKLIVDGENDKAVNKVVVNTDFTDVIVVGIDDNTIENDNGKKESLVVDAKRETFIYDESLGDYGAGVYAVPKINLSGSDVDKVNNEILDNYKEAFDFDDNFPKYRSLDYQYYVNDNILSVIITAYHHNNNVSTYSVYNIDLNTKKQLNNKEDISKVCGMDYSDVEIEVVDQMYRNLDQFSAYIDHEQLEIYNKLFTSEENLSKIELYISDDNQLKAVYRYFIPVAGEMFFGIMNLNGENNTTINNETENYQEEFINALIENQDIWKSPSGYGERVSFADLNSDGKLELISAYNPGTGGTHAEVYGYDNGKIVHYEPGDTHSSSGYVDDIDYYYDSIEGRYRVFALDGTSFCNGHKGVSHYELDILGNKFYKNFYASYCWVENEYYRLYRKGTPQGEYVEGVYNYNITGPSTDGDAHDAYIKEKTNKYEKVEVTRIYIISDDWQQYSDSEKRDALMNSYSGFSYN